MNKKEISLFFYTSCRSLNRMHSTYTFRRNLEGLGVYVRLLPINL